MPKPGLLAPLCAALLAAAVFFAQPCGAATWSADASISTEKKTEITEESDGLQRTSVETVKQTYNISYGFKVNPALDVAFKFGVDTTREIKEGPKPDTDFDTRQVKPRVDVGLKAAWWDLALGWTYTFDATDDPQKLNSDDWTWAVDLNIQPKAVALPSLKLKYKEAVDTDGNSTFKIEDTWDAALDYKFWKLLSVTLTGGRSLVDNKAGTIPLTSPHDTNDKNDLKYSTSVTLQKDFLSNLKLDAKWTNDRAQSRTLLAGGDEKERTDTLKNTVEGKVTAKPFKSVELSMDKKMDWNADLEKGNVEVTDTLTSKAAWDATLTKILDLKVSYDDNRVDKRNTDADSYQITRAYSTSVAFTPSKYLSLTPTLDRKNDDQWFDDPQTDPVHKRDDKWEVKGESALWKDKIKVSATRGLTLTTENGKTTANQSKWALDTNLTFDSVKNLSITPKYSYTKDQDLVKDTVAEQKKVEVAIKYGLDLGKVSKFAIDHTYGRTANYPAEGQATTKRDDSSNLTLSFNEFLRGMKLEFKYSRKASDESMDDKPHEIDYTYGATYDWTFLSNYKYSVQWTRDRKATPPGTETLKNTFDANFLKDLVTLSLQHEFTQQLESTTKDTHRYLIEVKGKF